MIVTLTIPNAEQFCVSRFVDHVNSVMKDLYGSPRCVSKLLSDKWIRIEKQELRENNGKQEYKTTSVYCFIARQGYNNKTMGEVVNGGLYKAASFKTAAKHHRGNIYDNVTFACAGLYGLEYLPAGRKAATV